MMRRLALLGLVVAMIPLGGCTTLFGPGEPDPEKLNESAEYEWNEDHNASIVVEENQFRAVYNVGNASELRTYRQDALGQESHLEVSAVQYRYPNGTIIRANDSRLSVSQTRDRTILDVPNESGGRVAFSAPRQGKQLALPVFVGGKTELTLPPGARVGVPLLSKVSPPTDDRSVTNNRMTLFYENVTAQNMNVRYYLQRDLWIFGSILGGAIVIGTGGALYYLRQIKKLKRRREETAIDIDTDDDDFRDDGPPPGMR